MNINFSNISSTLKKIITDMRGFRNNNFQNSGITNLKEIIKYEYNELGNEDIIYTLNKLYGYDTNKNTVDEIIDFISLSLSVDSSDLKAVWVTSYTAVEKLYKINKDDPISVFNFKDKDWMIISDLDEDGILIAYK